MSKLFEHRYLFVQHRLTADQKTTLQRIARVGTLAACGRSSEEVYRLFDRRCRTERRWLDWLSYGTREPVQAAEPSSGQAFQPELGEGDSPG